MKRGVADRADGLDAADRTGQEGLAGDGDLEVEAGRVVALVGPTGSGKTSLVALLARLYDPSAGTVEIDGADLRDVELTSLRRREPEV